MRPGLLLLSLWFLLFFEMTSLCLSAPYYPVYATDFHGMTLWKMWRRILLLSVSLVIWRHFFIFPSLQPRPSPPCIFLYFSPSPCVRVYVCCVLDTNWISLGLEGFLVFGFSLSCFPSSPRGLYFSFLYLNLCDFLICFLSPRPGGSRDFSLFSLRTRIFVHCWIFSSNFRPRNPCHQIDTDPRINRIFIVRCSRLGWIRFCLFWTQYYCVFHDWRGIWVSINSYHEAHFSYLSPRCFLGPWNDWIRCWMWYFLSTFSWGFTLSTWRIFSALFSDHNNDHSSISSSPDV